MAEVLTACRAYKGNVGVHYGSLVSVGQPFWTEAGISSQSVATSHMARPRQVVPVSLWLYEGLRPLLYIRHASDAHPVWHLLQQAG